MIHRGQVFVRAVDANGKYGNADVFDLDDESFKAFVVWMLVRVGAVFCLPDPSGPEFVLKTTKTFPVGE